MRTEWLFYQNVGLISLFIHNDSMYVRFGGIRNSKTWSKSTLLVGPQKIKYKESA